MRSLSNFLGPDPPAEAVSFKDKVDAYGEPDEGFLKHLSFTDRYQPDGTDRWLEEVDALDIDDLDEIDPAMLREAERRALRMALENEIRIQARQDLFVYASLRYGRYCPEPEKVVFPHQTVVIDDLMKMERSVDIILKMEPTEEELEYLAENPLKYWLTAPRGFVKSSTVSDYLEWKIGRDQTIKAKMVGANEKGTISQLGMIKKNVQLDPLFRSIFPEARLDPHRANNKTNLSLIVPPDMIDTRNANIEAWGYGSSPERGRTNLIWYDDVATFQNSIVKPEERESIKLKMKVTWEPLRSGPETLSIWCGTPFHDEDAGMTIYRKHAGWKKRFMKVDHDLTRLVDISQSEPTYYELPEKRWDLMRKRFVPWWPEERLRDLFKADPEEFRIAYFLESVNAESLKAKWKDEYFWGNPETDRRGCVQYGFSPSHPLYDCGLIITGVDLASGKKSISKNTAVATVGLMEDGTRVLLEVSYGKRDDLECITQLAVHCERWNPDLIIVEDNSLQALVVNLLKEFNLFDQRIETFTTDVFKEAKLILLSREFEDEKWVIPFEYAEDHPPRGLCKCGLCQAIREMLGYPDFITSDCLMAILFAREGLKRLGVGKEVSLDEWSLSI